MPMLIEHDRFRNLRQGHITAVDGGDAARIVPFPITWEEEIELERIF